MGIVKKILRSFVLPAAIQLKLDKVLLANAKNKFLIINFHGVRAKSGHTINNRHLPVSEFDKIIRYLKSNFNVIPLSQLFEENRTGKTPNKKTIALTFDDGYLNNFEVALSVLKKYQVPASFYIITKGLEESGFLAWPDKIDLAKATGAKIFKADGTIFSAPNFQHPTLGTDLISFLKSQGEKTDTIASDILHSCGDSYTAHQKNAELLNLVTSEQLKQFKDETLIEYGSHSHTHFNMEFLTDEKCEQELRTSKELLEKVIGRRVRSIAFPDGSYSHKTLEICHKVGIDNLLAVDLRHTEDKGRKDLLPRFTISNSTTFESNVLRLAKEYDQFSF
jgi:peptidoglycan/xylan/chitin deacetylase (PgdA/CDA1 family)